MVAARVLLLFATAAALVFASARRVRRPRWFMSVRCTWRCARRLPALARSAAWRSSRSHPTAGRQPPTAPPRPSRARRPIRSLSRCRQTCPHLPSTTGVGSTVSRSRNRVRAAAWAEGPRTILARMSARRGAGLVPGARGRFVPLGPGTERAGAGRGGVAVGTAMTARFDVEGPASGLRPMQTGWIDLDSRPRPACRSRRPSSTRPKGRSCSSAPPGFAASAAVRSCSARSPTAPP